MLPKITKSRTLLSFFNYYFIHKKKQKRTKIKKKNIICNLIFNTQKNDKPHDFKILKSQKKIYLKN